MFLIWAVIAKTILDDDGDVKDEITVQAPDVPYVRKGDLVITSDISGSLNEWFNIFTHVSVSPCFP